MSLLACIGLFAAVVATWIAVSGPGEAALVSAGTVAARGEEGIASILVIAFLGTFAGSLGAYWLGRAGGRRLFLSPGPLLAWRTRLLVRSEGLMQRRAFLASLFGPGWLAGINKQMGDADGPRRGRLGGAIRPHAPQISARVTRHW